MALTDKQKLFISEYCIDHNGTQAYLRAGYKVSEDVAAVNASDVTVENVTDGMIYLYLNIEKECDKKNAAWMISRLKPQYMIRIKDLLDIDEITRLAKLKQSDIQKLARFAQERRHEKRKDFSLTDNEWIAAIEYFNNECAYCGDKTHKLTYDHFKPFSKGGSFTKDNIIPCCSRCNSSKNNNDFKEWYKEQSFYSKTSETKIIGYLNMAKGVESYE